MPVLLRQGGGAGESGVGGGLKPTLHGVPHQGGGAGEVVLVMGGRPPGVGCFLGFGIRHQPGFSFARK